MSEENKQLKTQLLKITNKLNTISNNILLKDVDEVNNKNVIEFLEEFDKLENELDDFKLEILKTYLK